MLLIEFLRGWRAGHDDRACFLCAMVDLEFSWILKNKKTKRWEIRWFVEVSYVMCEGS
jgi:hypothetical protein